MPTLYVSEYAAIGTAQGGQIPVAAVPSLTTQTVSFTGTAGNSNAFSSATRYIRVHTDAICSILIGPGVTATTSSPRMAADQTEYFSVQPGDRVSAITNT